MSHKLYTLDERPELRRSISDLSNAVWPAFMQEDPIANRTWDYLFTPFARFQTALCDDEGNLLAAGKCVPLVWDGSLHSLPAGWDASMEQGMRDFDEGHTPTALTAYAIVVAPEQQGKGYSSVVLDAMCDVARQHGLHSVIACVRPTLKALYPLTPMERYVQWTRPDGSPFDPWIRVHRRAGAEQASVAPRSMLIEGSVVKWEEWTKMRFPESGSYVVPGALQPVEIDFEADLGRYVEPNVWMVHRVK